MLVLSPVYLRHTTLVSFGLNLDCMVEAAGAGSLSSPIVTCELAKSSNFDCFSIWSSGEWKAVQC